MAVVLGVAGGWSRALDGVTDNYDAGATRAAGIIKRSHVGRSATTATATSVCSACLASSFADTITAAACTAGSHRACKSTAAAAAGAKSGNRVNGRRNTIAAISSGRGCNTGAEGSRAATTCAAVATCSGATCVALSGRSSTCSTARTRATAARSACFTGPTHCTTICASTPAAAYCNNSGKRRITAIGPIVAEPGRTTRAASANNDCIFLRCNSYR